MKRTHGRNEATTSWLRPGAPALLMATALLGCGGAPEHAPDEEVDTKELAGALDGENYLVERCIDCSDHNVWLTQDIRGDDGNVKTTVTVTLTVGHVDHESMYLRRIRFDYYLWKTDGLRGQMYFWDNDENHFDEHNGGLDVAMPLWRTYYDGVSPVTPSGTWAQELDQWVYSEGDLPARFALQNNVIEVIKTWGAGGSSVRMQFLAYDPTYDKGGGTSGGGTSGGGGSSPPPVDQGCGHAILGAGAALNRGESVATCNGRVVLFHQDDGNIVLLHDGTPRWHTGTYGLQSETLIMQGDGNLVLYGPGNVPLWALGTHGHGGAFAAVQEDCNFVVYSGGSAPLWASGSTCY